MNKSERVNRTVEYIRKHGYEIIDLDAMPFNYGITKIDMIVYDRLLHEMVSIKVYSDTTVRENIMAEWLYRDRPYYKRATRRWCEKQRWHAMFRADMVIVRDNGEIDHVTSTDKYQIKRRSR